MVTTRTRGPAQPAAHSSTSTRQSSPTSTLARASSPVTTNTVPDPSQSTATTELPRAKAGEYPPGTYKPMRSERYVFNTPPYSGHIKQFWRFKDEHAARASCDTIWAIFERYADMDDFVGMDTCRKFLQMGRTRSMRYALRPGGKKYTKTDDDEGGRVEMPRDGTVYDQGKLDGARVFGSFEQRCWHVEGYRRGWAAYGGKPVPVSVQDGSATAGKREERASGGEQTDTGTVKGGSPRRGHKRKASPLDSEADTDIKPFRAKDEHMEDVLDESDRPVKGKAEQADAPVKSEPPPSPLRSVKTEPDSAGGGAQKRVRRKKGSQGGSSIRAGSRTGSNGS